MYSSGPFPTFSNIEEIKVTKCEFVFLRRFLFCFCFCFTRKEDAMCTQIPIGEGTMYPRLPLAWRVKVCLAMGREALSEAAKESMGL